MDNHEAYQLLWDVELFACIDESGHVHRLLDARDWLQERINIHAVMSLSVLTCY